MAAAKKPREDATLLALVFEYAEAKGAEEAAKNRRIAAEESIAEHLEFSRDPASETVAVTGPGGAAKFTIKQNVNVTVDAGLIPRVRQALGRGWFTRCFKAKYERKADGFKALKAEDRDRWIEASRAVSIKRGKVSIELKEIRKG